MFSRRSILAVYRIRIWRGVPVPGLLEQAGCFLRVALSSGMAMAILDGVDKWPKVPDEYALGSHGFRVDGKNGLQHYFFQQVMDQLVSLVSALLLGAAVIASSVVIWAVV